MILFFTIWFIIGAFLSVLDDYLTSQKRWPGSQFTWGPFRNADWIIFGFLAPIMVAIIYLQHVQPALKEKCVITINKRKE